MCGRFTLRSPASVVAEQFGLFEAPSFAPRFNIAPTQPVAVVRCVPDQAGCCRQIVWLRWGLVPSWAHDPSIGNRMINARTESVGEKPAYRAAMRRRRCLVAADGFYEWQKAGKRKQPFFIHRRDDRPFGFAALWESWEGPDHSALESCTLLTTEANEVVTPIHDRMPVILRTEDYTRWLDPGIQNPSDLESLLRPYSSDAMEAYPVSPHVNSPANEGPRCVQRIVAGDDHI
ncbi:MAG: SOS response-associated peptidase [Thermoguttaceae bacterium]